MTRAFPRSSAWPPFCILEQPPDPDTRKRELTQHEGNGDELDVAIAVQSQLLKHHLLFLREGHPEELGAVGG